MSALELTFIVTPAKAGVQGNRKGLWSLDPRSRGNDGSR